jgi:predicted metalloprotease with PDZ domain
MKRSTLLLGILLAVTIDIYAQAHYRYSIDLKKVEDDRLTVELLTPAVKKGEVDFHFPKIIPGTYRNSDYGRFISELKAFDKAGKLLPVKKTATNTWRITNAVNMHRITYLVDDTYNNKEASDIYSMSGTNIEAGKNFVINPFGFFGYLEGFRDIPFELTIQKPDKFYGATSLKPVSTDAAKDVFRLDNVDHLYDSPIMYNIPDTTVIKMGDTEVLISVYAPKKRVQSAFLAQHLRQLLGATTRYLGGRLPVDRYAFIFYFNSEQPSIGIPGALEHNTSSFYSLPETPQQQLIGYLMDIAAHEFLHIVTPLNVSSKEVKAFNYMTPVLSRHLWLYEGSTEYGSDHVQVKYGLNSVPQFLGKLTEKLNNSITNFNDTLPFTRLSKESAGQYKEQYPNVYEKGALIAAMLDIYITHLTNGGYDLQKLKHDLSVRYGKDKYFKDEELFDIITELTHPEIRSFFTDYVEGNKAIPYEKFFAMAGISYSPQKTVGEITMGNIIMIPNPQGKMVITDVSRMNEFGKRMGYQQNDEILSLNGMAVTPGNFPELIAFVKEGMKEGQELEVKVARKNESGGVETMRLAAPLMKITNTKKHVLEFMEQPTEQQVLVRNAWLSTPGKPVTPTAKYEDTKDIDAITKTLYAVISGPPGKRNWERFRSLFHPSASMAASHTMPNGQSLFNSFSTEDYIHTNGKHFEENGFFEEEIGRKMEQFGNVAIVRSAYQYRLNQNGPVDQRGVNFFSLVKDKGRWWITDILWQEETPAYPILAELLKK